MKSLRRYLVLGIVCACLIPSGATAAVIGMNQWGVDTEALDLSNGEWTLDTDWGYADNSAWQLLSVLAFNLTRGFQVLTTAEGRTKSDARCAFRRVGAVPPLRDHAPLGPTSAPRLRRRSTIAYCPFRAAAIKGVVS